MAQRESATEPGRHLVLVRPAPALVVELLHLLEGAARPPHAVGLGEQRAAVVGEAFAKKIVRKMLSGL